MKALLALLALSVLATATADPLRDPTRPPQVAGAVQPPSSTQGALSSEQILLHQEHR